MSKDDLDDERAVLEVVELSESEDEDFDYKAVEVWCGMRTLRFCRFGNVGPHAGSLFILFVLCGCMASAPWVELLYVGDVIFLITCDILVSWGWWSCKGNRA